MKQEVPEDFWREERLSEFPDRLVAGPVQRLEDGCRRGEIQGNLMSLVIPSFGGHYVVLPSELTWFATDRFLHGKKGSPIPPSVSWTFAWISSAVYLRAVLNFEYSVSKDMVYLSKQRNCHLIGAQRKP